MDVAGRVFVAFGIVMIVVGVVLMFFENSPPGQTARRHPHQESTRGILLPHRDKSLAGYTSGLNVPAHQVARQEAVHF